LQGSGATYGLVVVVVVAGVVVAGVVVAGVVVAVVVVVELGGAGLLPVG